MIDSNKHLAHFFAFLNWWREELAQLIPSRIKLWFTPQQSVTRIRLDKNGTEIIPPTINNIEPTSIQIGSNPASLSDNADFTRYLKNRVSGPVVLEFSHTLLLERTLKLPEAARHNYRNIISLQTEKYLPLPASEIYFQGVPDPADSNNGYFTLHLAMVKKTYTEPLMSLLKNQGAWVSKIVGVSVNRNIANIKFADFAEKHKSHENKLLLGFLLIGIGLVTVLFTSAHYQLKNRHEYLTESIKSLSLEASKTQSMQTEIKEAQQKKALHQQQINQVRLIDVLARLSELLPEDTWVYEYSQSKNHFTISGKTLNASHLLQIMDQDPMFFNLSNSSTITAQGETTERFTLSFQASNCEENCP
ncbi:PilN domain-containing protein [Porticoccaceae bacterium]|nr:PilN domain-containing protein [Porticoccaceae bacterium]